MKEIDSLARKLDGELKYIGPSDFERIHAAENGINDAVRYTAMVPENGYWGHGDAVIQALEECGFTLTKDPGGWEVPEEYRGRNLTFLAPDGVRFEVQIHTGDSLSAAEQTHLIYEEQRLPTTLRWSVEWNWTPCRLKYSTACRFRTERRLSGRIHNAL